MLPSGPVRRGHAAWAALWVACLSSVGCSSRRVLVAVDPELEDGALWRGLLLEDADGTLVASTGLAREDGGAAVVFELGADDVAPQVVFAVGYTDDQLAALDPPAADGLLAQPLARADAAAPLLPAPAFSARGALDGDVVTLKPDAAPPALTAPWLPRCPELDAARSAVDVACGSLYCAARFVQAGCEVQVNTGLCGLGTIDGLIDGRGKLTFGAGAGLGACTRTEPVSGAHRSLVCTGGGEGACRIDLHWAPAAARFDIGTAVAVDAEPITHEKIMRPAVGYLGGLAALEETVAVATHAGRVDGWQCTSTSSGAVVLIQQSSLAVVATVPAPPCLTHIARDPSGDGFIGVFGGVSPSLGRFDAGAHLIEAVPVVDAALTAGHFAVGITTTAAPPSIAVAFTRLAEPVDARVVLFDVQTLAVAAVSVATLRKLRGISAGAPGELVSIDEHMDRVLVFDARTAELDAALPLGRLRDGIGPRLGRVGFADGHVLVSTVDDNASMHTVDVAASTHAYATFFEWPAEPFAFAAWPAVPGLQLVGVTEPRDARRASVALFHPDPPHFLAGAAHVGHGVVGDMVTDAGGRAWLTLPWSGHVVRVGPSAL